ncbi:uncharacterized protein N7459_000448 [Penicillium hispanicum]|uniref:uncharacterized protein n=1 Tax=Penicillium hispanicum TaxID=1080232 RepID=UPI00254150D4|nr:uncharacterized protein N7459_000448 [Penicillium hispanicum]KAJ5594240.1 hypothetical protein N7459_000448 [Penicillium hispanicum]
MTTEIFEQIASALVGAVASMVAPFLASVVDLKAESTVEDAMYKAFNLTRTTVESYLDGLLNTVPKNTDAGNAYGERSGGFPQMIYNGSWAAPVSSEKVQNMDLTLSSSILLLVITIYANMEGVYMVETDDMKAYAGDTCGADLEDDLVRVCVGDKAYFWLKEDYTYWKKGSSKITGFDDDTLGDYQLSLEKLANAYMYSKDQNGGDNWTVKSAINAFSSGGSAPPDYMFASMKVCTMTTKQIEKVEKKKREVPKVKRLNPGSSTTTTCESDGVSFSIPPSLL